VSEGEEPVVAPQPLFVTTRWSVVLAAQDRSSPDSAAALEVLCRAYWYPLYVYVLGTGHTAEAAQDLTQEFFARLLARDWLRVVLPDKGRFRTFLLVAMKRFLTNEWHRGMRQKRGQRPPAVRMIGELYVNESSSARHASLPEFLSKATTPAAGFAQI